MGLPDDTSLEGTLEKIVFQNADNHFLVGKLLRANGDLVTIVGALAAVSPGTGLRLTGKWANDPRFGPQFRVESFQTKSPETLVGIERFLGSGLIYGIGAELARRLVETFGHETLDVIEHKPNRLVDVPGIGLARATRIHEAYKAQRGVQDVLVFLRGHGVAGGAAARIIKRYGDKTINVVRDNPYRLAVEVWGIGFTTADGIAKKLGLPLDAPARLEAGVMHVLTTRLDDGHLYTPRGEAESAAAELLGVAREAIVRAVDTLIQSGLIVREQLGAHGVCVALTIWADMEHRVATLMRSVVDTPGRTLALDVPEALAEFETRFGIELAPAQREAIAAAISEKCTVITGGPGVGKTTIVKGVLHLAHRARLRVALCAPTGRAAKRLSETTGKEGLTLHRLLEFNPQAGEFARNRETPLELEMVICDETSMVDLPLFLALLEALPPRAQLVLVGDTDQLPSVGPGAVLADVISSEATAVVRLTQIFRQAQESRIVRNAHRINQGQMPELDAEEGTDFFFIGRDDPEQARDVIVDLVATRIPAKFGYDPMTDIQVLTPMHRGPLGTGALADALQAKLNGGKRGVSGVGRVSGTAANTSAVTAPSGGPMVADAGGVDTSGVGGAHVEWKRGDRVFRPGDKVMQLRNDYEHGVFNGDAGIITAQNAEQMIVDFDGRLVQLGRDEVDQLTLAYAISIHKSQGSEYPVVIVVCSTQHFVMLERSLLYTAVTRGKKLVIVVGSRNAVSIAVRNAGSRRRLTWLAERLRDGR